MKIALAAAASGDLDGHTSETERGSLTRRKQLKHEEDRGDTRRSGAAIACAPVAQADNDQYDQYMISHGMVSGAGTTCAPANPNCGQSLEFLLQEGQKACAAFAHGVSDTSVTGQLEGSPEPLNPGTSVNLSMKNRSALRSGTWGSLAKVIASPPATALAALTIGRS